MADPSGTPSSVFKHAINLNRYETGVAKKLMITYNRILVDATKELQSMSSEAYSSSYRAKRLRQIIGSLKTSLNGWAGDASKFMTKDLDELAKIESEFALAQLLQEIPEADGLIRELEISPQFAKAVVTKDPTELNLVTTEAGDSLTGKGVYKLTAKQGTPMVLPNGDTVEKAFRGIANTSAQKFRMTVQTGMLTGLSTDKIVRQIIGTQDKFNFEGMEFGRGQKASARAIALAGGKDGTRLANNQIMTLVRTSVNQVSNTASQETYKANSEVTKKYRYVATLDSNTTLLCASKDGKLFDYEEGPMPPLHFNCRSTTVPVIDWDGLEKDYGIVAPDKIEGVGEARRQSKDGLVPATEKYGDWLYSKRVKEGRKVLPGVEQIDALGYDKAVYFNRLAARYKDPNKAIVSLVREDGTEKTLSNLRRDYKLKKVVRPSEPTIVIKNEKQLDELAKNIRAAQAKAGSIASTTVGSPEVEAQLQKLISYREEGIKGMVESSWNQIEELGGETGANSRKMRRFMTKHNIFNNFTMKGEKWKSSNAAWYYKADLKKSMDSAVKDLEKYGEYNRTYVGKEKSWFLRKAARIKDGNGRNETLKLLLESPGSRANGYTFMTSNIINTKLTGVSTRITASRAQFIKKTAAEVLAKTVEANKLLGKSPVNMANVIDWTTGSTVYKTEKGSNWIVTMIHEIGHQVHAKGSGGVALGSKWKGLGGVAKVTGYAYKNPREQFAEGFVQYVLNPEGLKQEAPRVYNWVEETLEEALK